MSDSFLCCTSCSGVILPVFLGVMCVPVLVGHLFSVFILRLLAPDWFTVSCRWWQLGPTMAFLKVPAPKTFSDSTSARTICEAAVHVHTRKPNLRKPFQTSCFSYCFKKQFDSFVPMCF